MNRFLKNLTFYLLVVALLFSVFSRLGQKVVPKELGYSDFLRAIDDGRVASVTFQDRQIQGTFRAAEARGDRSSAADPTAKDPRGSESSAFYTFLPQNPDDKDLLPLLRKQGVMVKVVPPTVIPWYLEVLFQWLPIIVFIGFWIYILQKTNGNGARAMSFGKSRGKLVPEAKLKETFKDVAGCDEAKEELREVVEFLKDPGKFQRLGGRLPKGVLLVGPPGTGKTLLARAVAGEAGVPFFNISGSEFVEMFVGVGASRVRDLFAQGKKSAPCLIFIDELDAVGRQRGTGLGGGHDEREQTLNQMLVEMDGFETTEGIILIAATNRPDVLDPALLRPGRFDRQIIVDFPDLKGRLEVLKVHTRKIPIAPEVNLETVARGTPGLAGADLANLVNEAAIMAARLNKSRVDIHDFEQAKDKIMMGAERKSRILSDEERKITAYHEAGHTLVSKLLPGTDPIHKVTIIPRGRALGVTHSLPEADRYHYSKQHFVNQITILMGGRCSEELIFTEMYTGAAHDMSTATALAHNMVTAWGMSEKLGPMTFGRREEHIFLGREIARIQDYSDITAKTIDEEVSFIIKRCYEHARALVHDNVEKLHNLAKALLEKETINGEEVEDILQGRIPAVIPAVG